MSEYRIYFLDGQNHVQHAVDVEAEDDEAAAAEAANLRPAASFEVWRLDRFRWRFEPSSERPGGGAQSGR